MDLRLVICVALVACVAVEARSVIGPRCRRHCRFGYLQGTCQCKPNPFQPINPCAVRFCPANTVCVPTGPRDAACRPILPPKPVKPVVPVDACHQPKKVGPCKASFTRYFYNSASGKCESFIYGGCLGNENNFDTYRQCNARCIPRRGYY